MAEASTSSATQQASRHRPPTVTKAELAKRKIEALFASLADEREAAANRAADLEQRLHDMDIADTEKTRLRKQHAQQEMAFLRDRRRPMCEADFEMITVIGKGAFGEVILVRHRTNRNYYAMKKLRKADMQRKEQNKDYLYLVMEFLPGGDLMTLLIKRDTLSEDDARFYIAEMIVAIDTIHKLGFIHRDIKPDNLLIDKNGHLKLSDFGLCKSFQVDDFDALPNPNTSTNSHAPQNLNEMSMSERTAAWRQSSRKQAFSTVGTPDYISCEILMKRGYNKECDYWSLGVVLYEMLVGYPPFYAEDALKTCRKILNWRETLRFPDEANLSWEAKDLIQSLVCDPKYRLGATGGIDDFRVHPFFKDVDWDNLNQMQPPFVPELHGPTDTRYFEDHKPTQPNGPIPQMPVQRPSYIKSPAEEEFIGFTFKRYNASEPPPGRRGGLSSSLFTNPEEPPQE